ncbi:ABC-2 type transport system ATP-binding protein [Pelagirhabdus alkalitolerans]|uniref:ABC-2 type transport system ATP-binding protein n=1 Tax=Pelagirhabdus alkalitolerans TaxID=1612202 RepID=A0A1G6HHX7_9BACI|nr:ABC transporter ATP-binding protein [Pelagirhabdus alkalitolerans]SDB93794.1 ABC-2 type transport system ATP-binding protein [Pelagirhabdus alkalitolerans]
MTVIKADQLTKSYKGEQALDALTVQFEGDKIIGLLGKNGAGKTTLMRLLAGHFKQTSGNITINDQEPFNNYFLTRDICFIQENNNFFEKFKVNEVIQLASQFYPNWDEEEANQLLKTFQLNRKQKINALSKGMLSALGIIVGIASHAPITIFDEPYIGLDASYRSVFYDKLLESYQSNKRMIILSTHLIDEVSRLFEEVAILHEGKLHLHEISEQLKDNHWLLRGKKETIDQETNHLNVIHSSEFLGKKTVVVYDTINEQHETIEYDKLSLQQLFVYLTKEEVAQDGQ